MPEYNCVIEIIVESSEGKESYLCEWNPKPMPNGLVGTATVIFGVSKGIGFHAWAKNNNEFIFYKIIYKDEPQI